ncbi:hypothetical protein E2320_007737, partial [Naja naja]
ESCCWSAFKCFVNETLLLKPAHSQNEKVFNTTLSRIQFSQRNVQLLLCNSESDCDKVWFMFTIYFIINWLTVSQTIDIFFLNPLYYNRKVSLNLSSTPTNTDFLAPIWKRIVILVLIIQSNQKQNFWKTLKHCYK